MKLFSMFLMSVMALPAMATIDLSKVSNCESNPRILTVPGEMVGTFVAKSEPKLKITIGYNGITETPDLLKYNAAGERVRMTEEELEERGFCYTQKMVVNKLDKITTLEVSYRHVSSDKPYTMYKVRNKKNKLEIKTETATHTIIPFVWRINSSVYLPLVDAE